MLGDKPEQNCGSRSEPSDLQHAGAEGPAVVVPRGHLKGGQERLPSLHGVKDAVHPQAGRAIADVGLFLVAGLDLTAQLVKFLGVRFMTDAMTASAAIRTTLNMTRPPGLASPPGSRIVGRSSG